MPASNLDQPFFSMAMKFCRSLDKSYWDIQFILPRGFSASSYVRMSKCQIGKHCKIALCVLFLHFVFVFSFIVFCFFAVMLLWFLLLLLFRCGQELLVRYCLLKAAASSLLIW